MRKSTDPINRDVDEKVAGHTENPALALFDKLFYVVSLQSQSRQWSGVPLV